MPRLFELPPAVWGVGGVLVGLVLGIVLATWFIRASRVEIDPAFERPEPVSLDPRLLEVLSVLRSGAMVIGPHDEVVHATPQARSMTLCRGDRISPQTLLDSVRQVRREGSPTAFDTEIGRGFGAPVLHLSVRVTPLGDDGSVLVLADDRTPMLRVDETRRDFVANVSHELKTPIGAIALLSEAVEEAADEPDAVRHFASRMQGEARRLTELVTQIIDLSRLQSDDPMLKADLVEVSEVIDGALQRSRELAAKRQVNLVRIGTEEVEVLGDVTQLVDAVSNLVQNAIVYSNVNARVAISTEVVHHADGDSVEISVADNGIGIKPADQQRIFERFYRVDYGRSRDNGGTGLGLSIVKHIAAMHGGSVHLWSQLGQGSTFTLRLPVGEPEAASLPEIRRTTATER